MTPSNKQVAEDREYLFDMYGHVDDFGLTDTDRDILRWLLDDPTPRTARRARIHQIECWFAYADDDTRDKAENDPIVKEIARRYKCSLSVPPYGRTE